MGNGTPVVSVVISTYNRAAKLKRALQSVLSQTYQDFEIIVVDNASVDETAEVIRDLPEPRVKYLRHEYNKGGPAARNTGIREALGKYIALLDDDDEWLPDKLMKQVTAIEAVEPRIGVVYVGCEIYDDIKGKVDQVYHPQDRGNIYLRLLRGTTLGSVSNVLIRKACFEKAGLFDEELTSCQDWDMWLRISRDYEFDFVPEILTRIHHHGTQISTDYAVLIPGRTRMVAKHRDEFKAYPSIFVIHLKRLGKLHCLNGTWKEAGPWFKEAVCVRPLESIKILAWVLLEWPWVSLSSRQKEFKKCTLTQGVAVPLSGKSGSLPCN